MLECLPLCLVPLARALVGRQGVITRLAIPCNHGMLPALRAQGSDDRNHYVVLSVYRKSSFPIAVRPLGLTVDIMCLWSMATPQAT